MIAGTNAGGVSRVIVAHARQRSLLLLSRSLGALHVELALCTAGVGVAVEALVEGVVLGDAATELRSAIVEA